MLAATASGNPGPVAFISSFSNKAEFESRKLDCPLHQLRLRIHAINQDQEFRKVHGYFGKRELVWVAEMHKAEIPQNDHLAIIDYVIDVLKASDLYICILADSRRGQAETGTPISVREKITRVSFFEIELYAAAMYRKPTLIYALEGFDPGPRLTQLLQILSWSFPGREKPPLVKSSDIVKDVRRILAGHSRQKLEPAGNELRKLVTGLFKQRESLFLRRKSKEPLLFLAGQFEVGAYPDKDQIVELIHDYRREPNFQRKSTRIWLAVRVLMTASYMHEDVQQDQRLKEFLPLWDVVLADWAGIAAWQGWHGHLFAGTVAPLNSQSLIRSQSFKRHPELSPEIFLPPTGGLASAFYNIAKVTKGVVCGLALHRASQLINQAFKEQGGPTDNLLAIRGSIKLRQGRLFGAKDDFMEMLRIREKEQAGPAKIADAYMHIGQAFAFMPFSRKAEDFLKKAVAIFEGSRDNPNLPRARRKLMLFYRKIGKKKEAEECRILLAADVARQGTTDQLDVTQF